MLTKRVLSIGFLCLAASTVAAQDTAPLTDPGTKSVRIVRTDKPPVIDGDLSDAVWANAAVIDDMHQISPVEYAVPYEATAGFQHPARRGDRHR